MRHTTHQQKMRVTTPNLPPDDISPEKLARYGKIARVLWIVLALNLLVAVGKIILGWLTSCLSILADGFHSLSDGASNIIGLYGIHLSRQPRDFDHPYGHRRYETLASLAIAFLLLFVVFNLAGKALHYFKDPHVPEVLPLSFAVMIGTMVINIFVTLYERKKARALKSDLLLTDSLHTLSDVVVTISVIAGLFFIKLGLYWVDPFVTLLVALMIFKVVVDIVRHSSDVLCDHIVLDAGEVQKMVMRISGIKGCHMVRSRGRSDDVQLDLHVLVADQTNIKEAHRLSHEVESSIRQHFSGVSDVIVHVEPESSIEEGHI